MATKVDTTHFHDTWLAKTYSDRPMERITEGEVMRVLDSGLDYVWLDSDWHVMSSTRGMALAGVEGDALKIYIDGVQDLFKLIHNELRIIRAHMEVATNQEITIDCLGGKDED